MTEPAYRFEDLFTLTLVETTARDGAPEGWTVLDGNGYDAMPGPWASLDDALAAAVDYLEGDLPLLADGGDDAEADPDPVPAKRGPWHVCSLCEGEGTVVNGAVSVWTQDDVAEDPEGFEDMLHGVYDVPCPKCGGRRVTDEQDEAAWRERQDERRLYALESGDPELYCQPY